MFTREAKTGYFAPTEGRWGGTAVVENGDPDVAPGKDAEVWARQFRPEGAMPSASAPGVS